MIHIIKVFISSKHIQAFSSNAVKYLKWGKASETTIQVENLTLELKRYEIIFFQKSLKRTISRVYYVNLPN